MSLLHVGPHLLDTLGPRATAYLLRAEFVLASPRESFMLSVLCLLERHGLAAWLFTAGSPARRPVRAFWHAYAGTLEFTLEREEIADAACAALPASLTADLHGPHSPLRA